MEFGRKGDARTGQGQGVEGFPRVKWGCVFWGTLSFGRAGVKGGIHDHR